jgi:hypothetical protein
MVGYPPEWTSQRLGAIGLDATPAFFDMLRVTEADVFQYVGVAVPAGVATLATPQRDAFVFPPDLMLEQSNRLHAENRRLADENARLGAQFAELQAWVVGFKKNPARAVAASLKRRLARR